MKQDTPTSDHAVFVEGTYAWFHMKLIGKHFQNKYGKQFSKLELFNEHCKSPAMLRMLIANGHPELKQVDKPGWADGILQDLRSYSRDAMGRLSLG